jgi:hypothetical protein
VLVAVPYVLFTAAAVIGAWICVRVPPSVPRSFHGAALCGVCALLAPSLGLPLLPALAARVPTGFSLLLSEFPAFVLAFALLGLSLRYFVARLGPTLR